jgi:hypothetical protein
MYQLKNKFYIEEIYYLTNFKWLKNLQFSIFLLKKHVINIKKYVFIKKKTNTNNSLHLYVPSFRPILTSNLCIMHWMWMI